MMKGASIYNLRNPMIFMNEETQVICFPKLTFIDEWGKSDGDLTFLTLRLNDQTHPEEELTPFENQLPSQSHIIYQIKHPFIAISFTRSNVLSVAHLTDKTQPLRVFEGGGSIQTFVDLK